MRHIKSSFFKEIQSVSTKSWCISFLLGSLIQPTWSTPTEEDGSLWQQGIAFRNQKKFEQAIPLFLPLAEKKDVKAQHNVAFCHYELGNETDAYTWYKSASEKGFKPSIRNLNRMNLMELLLPKEILFHIADFLSLADFSRFSRVSKRTQTIFEEKMISTNFLTDKQNYATDFRIFFKDVVFDPKPEAIRLKHLVKTDRGPIEVHFRGGNHLHAIVEKTPVIEPGLSESLYFVRDLETKDGQEFVATEGGLSKSFFVHIMADYPINLSGDFELDLPIYMPLNSNHSKLSARIKGFSKTNILQTYKSGFDLAAALENFDETLLQKRTAEGIQLLKAQKEQRRLHPELFPDLLTLCPNVLLLNERNDVLTIDQGDKLKSSNSLIYAADSVASLASLEQDLPTASNEIFYIDPLLKISGIYCQDALTILKGFKITSSGNLAITGDMFLQNHYLDITVKKNIWITGVNITGETSKINIGKINMQHFLLSHIKSQKSFHKPIGKLFRTFGVIQHNQEQ